MQDGKIAIFSRNSENNTSKYPDIIAALPSLLQDKVKSIVLDCEAVAYDKEQDKILPFQVSCLMKHLIKLLFLFLLLLNIACTCRYILILCTHNRIPSFVLLSSIQHCFFLGIVIILLIDILAQVMIVTWYHSRRFWPDVPMNSSNQNYCHQWLDCFCTDSLVISDGRKHKFVCSNRYPSLILLFCVNREMYRNGFRLVSKKQVASIIDVVHKHRH